MMGQFAIEPVKVANQDRKQTSARKASSGEVSAARQTGAGKTRTAAPQNGQIEPHYHPRGQGDLRCQRKVEMSGFLPY